MLSDFGLTNPSYQLLQVSFYTAVVGAACTSDIHIFDGSGVTDLLVPAVTIQPTNLAYDWVAVDLSARNLMVSGSFYVAVRSRSGCGFAVGWDSLPNSLGSPARSYDSPSLDTPVWALFDNENLMFRAQVGAVAGPVAHPVGGFVEPVNKLAVFAPYLALFGVIGVVAVIYWKRPDN